MTPAKIKEHEPTAVKREMTERITEPGQTGTNSDDSGNSKEKGYGLRVLLSRNWKRIRTRFTSI